MTDIPTITPLPDPPQRGQDAAVFVQKADAFIDALTDFVAEMNVFGDQLVDATAERVVDEAAVSFAGATAAKNAAVAARDAAQGYAAAINPAGLVHTTGNESIAGIKDFTGTIKLAGTALQDAATKAKATVAQLRARQADVAVTADLIKDALAYVNVPYAATMTLDCQTGVNFETTLTGNVTTLGLSNPIIGATLTLYVIGDSATLRSIAAFSSSFKGDLPPLTDITSSKAYELTIKVRGAAHFVVTAVRAL